MKKCCTGHRVQSLFCQLLAVPLDNYSSVRRETKGRGNAGLDDPLGHFRILQRLQLCPPPPIPRSFPSDPGRLVQPAPASQPPAHKTHRPPILFLGKRTLCLVPRSRRGPGARPRRPRVEAEDYPTHPRAPSYLGEGRDRAGRGRDLSVWVGPAESPGART